MPTYEALPEFIRNYERMTRDQRMAFQLAVEKFRRDLEAGRFRAGLRVKGVRSHSGVFEMTWAPDGRATFHFGDEHRPGEAHVVWRRVGTHDILRRP